TGESPPKSWEQAGGSSDSGTFKPPSIGSTNDVVEASGTARPGEIVSTTDKTTAVNRNVLGRPLPNRPWEQQTYGSTCGGYSSSLNYNSGYGSGSSYDGLGSYGGGLYGNGMYRGGYGGLYENSGMYGGGMYGGGLGGFGGPMGGYGMGGMGPYGEQDSNNPFGAPPSPLGFWISFLHVILGKLTRNQRRFVGGRDETDPTTYVTGLDLSSRDPCSLRRYIRLNSPKSAFTQVRIP
ncbi:hypothetical protein Gogos_021083, partial [Gossypium gossypioides]|nr:hypothetical protein [Gossypium gossypioides]